MIRYYMIKLQDYLAMGILILKHLHHRWKVESSAIISIIGVLLLSLFFPFMITIIENYSLDGLYEVSMTYGIIMIIGISCIVLSKSNLTFSKFIYENKYCFRLYRFMLESYNGIIREYEKFLLIYKIKERDYNHRSYDLIVISTIFLKIFEMYFDNMKHKCQSSEPYLIDIQEMKNLYHTKEFNDFYASLFFKTKNSSFNTPYEQVLLRILDEVMSTLYKKPWFVDYYDEYTIFKMVKYILSNWYNKIIQYNINQCEAFN